MAFATVSATLKGKQKRRQSNSNNFRHLPRKLPKSPYSKRSSLLCVVNSSDTTSYTSVKGNISVHHVQKQPCVVTCCKSLFSHRATENLQAYVLGVIGFFFILFHHSSPRLQSSLSLFLSLSHTRALTA